MKILLTGVTGQLGFELKRALAALGDIVALSSAQLDLTDEVAIRDVVARIMPDVIVNPAAYTAVDKAESEPDLAWAVNARAPQILAEEAAKSGALLVHYSTDYVFDGAQATPYSETAIPNPQSVYGTSKLAGEQAIRESEANYFILRTAWVAGVYGGNFAKTMLRLAQERDTLSVVADQWGAPTTASLIADVSAHLIHHTRLCRADNTCKQTYHVVASGQTNWHEYACYVLERAAQAGMSLRVTADQVQAISTSQYPTPAKRPAHSVLDTTKLTNTFQLRMPTWQSGIDHLLQQLLLRS